MSFQILGVLFAKKWSKIVFFHKIYKNRGFAQKWSKVAEIVFFIVQNWKSTETVCHKSNWRGKWGLVGNTLTGFEQKVIKFSYG
jgi:hypothetical protein